MKMIMCSTARLNRVRPRTHGGAVLAGLSLLAWGAGRAAQASVTLSPYWARIATDTFGSIFARGAGGAGRTRVTLRGENKNENEQL